MQYAQDEGAMYDDAYPYEDQQTYDDGYDAQEDALGYEYAFEANSAHLALVEAKPNPKAQHPHTLTRGFEKFAFPKLVRYLRSADLTHKQKALLGAAELLATGESAVQCLSAGVCAAVTTLLDDPDALVRERAAAALEVTARTPAGCEAMLADGAVPRLVAMLDDPVKVVRDAAYAALVEAAARSVRVQTSLITTDQLQPLVQKAVEEEVGRSSMALELLRTCLSGVREPAVDALLACDAIGSLKPLLALRDPAVLEGALAVISLLCVPFEGKETAVAAGCVPALVTLLADDMETVCSNALAALMYITVANSGKAAVLQANGLPPLLKLLDVDDEKVLVNVLQVVTNVAELPAAREQLLPAAGALEFLMHHHAALIQRYAAQAKRYVDFTELPYPSLRGEAR